MTSKSLKASIDLRSKLSGSSKLSENLSGFESFQHLKSFLDPKSKEPKNSVAASLDQLNVDQKQIDDDTISFFGDEEVGVQKESNQDSEVSINITVKSGKVEVNS